MLQNRPNSSPEMRANVRLNDANITNLKYLGVEILGEKGAPVLINNAPLLDDWKVICEASTEKTDFTCTLEGKNCSDLLSEVSLKRVITMEKGCCKTAFTIQNLSGDEKVFSVNFPYFLNSPFCFAEETDFKSATTSYEFPFTMQASKAGYDYVVSFKATPDPNLILYYHSLDRSYGRSASTEFFACVGFLANNLVLPGNSSVVFHQDLSCLRRITY